MLFPHMFYGFVWVSVVFMEPFKTPFDLEAGMAAAKAAFGIEAYAYWEFLCRPDAHEIIKKNVSARECPLLDLVRPLIGSRGIGRLFPSDRLPGKPRLLEGIHGRSWQAQRGDGGEHPARTTVMAVR